MAQHKAFVQLKHHLCSVLVLTFQDLQQSFEINTNSSNYTIVVVPTQQGRLASYHSETLFDTIWKYHTYDKEMYAIVHAYRQWKYYIVEKEMIIHIDHKPLQFMQTQRKLQKDDHKKWCTYM